VHPRRRVLAFLLTAITVALICTVTALGARSSHSSSAATPKRGGHITIARIEDSTSFDKTNVFQNESIWLTEQINESLYEAGNDGKTTRSRRTGRPTRSSCVRA
jgi:peptide/nickel transport system substrate-binding protein